MYDCVKSAAYPLLEIIFREYCELNYIKLGHLFHAYKIYILGEKTTLVSDFSQNGKTK